MAGGEVSTAWPPTNVVAAIVYAPGQVLLGTVKGNENVFFVFAGRKNGGVVNITVLEGPQPPDCTGAVNVN
jgi:hypothetical protein